jgi:hypothetical protein
VTLLELLIASSMLAVILTSLSLVLRTARTAWEANDNDYGALHHGHTVARHFVRQAREARMVSSLPSSGDAITLEMHDGSQHTWSHVSSSGELADVVFLTLSTTGRQIPLAYNIRDLSFTGYEADGVSLATEVDDVRLVEIRVTVVLPRGAQPQQTVSSRVWIRAW